MNLILKIYSYLTLSYICQKCRIKKKQKENDECQNNHWALSLIEE
jgi:hypothetical protein